MTNEEIEMNDREPRCPESDCDGRGADIKFSSEAITGVYDFAIYFDESGEARIEMHDSREPARPFKLGDLNGHEIAWCSKCSSELEGFAFYPQEPIE